MHTTLIPATLNPPISEGRSEGVHLSRVIKAVAVQSPSQILDAKYAEDLSLEEVHVGRDTWWDNLPMHVKIKMSMGLAWEDWYVPQLGSVAYHPGEMCLEGVYMTHDGESLDTVWTGILELCCHEIKVTYKSTKTVGDLLTQWMWLAQIKCYCKALGVRTAFLHVLFVCGDYKYPITPQLKVWRIDFTQEEIDEDWDIIIGYVRHQQAVAREDAGLEGGV